MIGYMPDVWYRDVNGDRFRDVEVWLKTPERTIAMAEAVHEGLAWPEVGLTQEQIKALTPMVGSRVRIMPDESQLRREHPTLWDLAKLTPLQRWKRTHVEELREPLPGSGLIVAGDVSLTSMQYARAAARNKTPGPLRVRVAHMSYEHTMAPCESHQLRPVGWESWTTKRIMQEWGPGHRFHYVPQADHLHDVDVRLVEAHDDGKYEWRCRHCEQSGYMPYTLTTLAKATGVVWHQCDTCSRSEFWNAPRPDLPMGCPPPSWASVLSKRDFLKFGLGAAAAYTTWISYFRERSRIPIPFVPPVYGAANTFFVNPAVAGPGTGTTGDPYKLMASARSGGAGGVMVTNNADTLKIRGSDSSGNRCDESFSEAAQFPSGSSYALATVLTNDTAHTPFIKKTTSHTGIFINTGASSQYKIFSGLTMDGTNSNTGNCFLNYTSQNSPGLRVANAAHHIRLTGCALQFVAASLGSLYGNAFAHDCEILSSTGREARTGTQILHFIYQSGTDNLAQGCEGYDCDGYGLHNFSDTASEHAVDRCATRYSTFHNNTGRGMRTDRNDVLIYYGTAYNNLTGSGGLFVASNAVNLKFLNYSIVGNFAGGIWVFAGSTSTFRNIVAVSNGGNGNFLNQAGAGCDHSTGSTNSWNLGSFTANFVDEAAKDFRLLSTSSAIGIGVSILSHINAGPYPVSAVVDYAGVSVPQDGTVDSGAYEFVTAESPPAPPGAGIGSDNVSPLRKGRIRR